jgi:NADPH-dependent ferric siderophore reductase
MVRRGRGARAAGARLALRTWGARAALAQLHGAHVPPRAGRGRRRLLPARRPRTGRGLGRSRGAGRDRRLRRPARALADDDAGWSLLAADETGLPALLAILETLPRGHRAIALAEVHDDGEHQSVECPADLDLRWLSRAGRPPGTTTLLADAVAGVTLPPGPGRAWGGGEALAMRGVRDALRATGVPRESMHVLGYWKHRLTPEDVDD